VRSRPSGGRACCSRATKRALDNVEDKEANDTISNDAEVRQRLLELNLQSFHRIVGTLLEVNGRSGISARVCR
jgi:cobalamin biosynthesis Mg chelatase CobN